MSSLERFFTHTYFRLHVVLEFRLEFHLARLQSGLFGEPTRTRGRSPKLQLAWEGPYKVITRINDVVYRVQRHPRSRMMVVHLRQIGAVPGSCSGRAALRRGQCDILGFLGGVAYVRSPWTNNVYVTATIDSAKLLQFHSNATMKTFVSPITIASSATM
jgi:hypothetical protein